MSQQFQLNPGGATQPEAPVKRKRGRPRKDETQAQAHAQQNKPPLAPMVTGTRLDSSGAPKPTLIPPTPSSTIPSKGKEPMQVDINQVGDEDDHSDEMVGKKVTGVLENAFDEGYILTVRVGESDVYMRGVVFKDECVVPITPENDIAPNVNMCKGKGIQFQSMLPPQVAQPIENIDHQQQQQHHQNEAQNVSICNLNIEQNPQVVPNPEHEKPLLDMGLLSLGPSEPAEDKALESCVLVQTGGDQVVVGEGSCSKIVNEPQCGSKHKQESPMNEVLGESSEPQTKFQKTEHQTINSCSIAQPQRMNYEPEIGTSEVATAVSPKDVFVQPQPTFTGEEAVVEPQVVQPEIDTSSGFVVQPEIDTSRFIVGPEIRSSSGFVGPEIGSSSGFQVSMENTDIDEPNPSDGKPMGTH